MPPSLSRPGNKRQKANLYGQRSEALAAFFLQLKFYRIRDRRYKTPGGEIDVVAERGGTIVFVEVKSRLKAASEAEALEAINQARIIRAAEHWLSRHPREAEKSCRFDVIFLAPGRWPRHLINAFDAGA
ncbi:MAG: YraN family protein [Devosia sp.]|jgi:putative endonuclease|uniref:YraN family protein n=1 Tax=unclassified Devosia TaxID=196773 RepID=UPI0019E0F0B0|nr:MULTISPECIES: YraN family protein [unclassified Devosia]MBF0677325.1 YraN family protein [Devosia sp.]WEJ33387.1 YraN family protein [Devosia sp. SD17-2]